MALNMYINEVSTNSGIFFSSIIGRHLLKVVISTFLSAQKDQDVLFESEAIMLFILTEGLRFKGPVARVQGLHYNQPAFDLPITLIVRKHGLMDVES